MVVSLMAMRPLLRRFGHAMTKTISKIRKDSREQRYKEPRLPSYIGGDMSEEKTPLPYNTDRWWKWPVDLDINVRDQQYSISIPPCLVSWNVPERVTDEHVPDNVGDDDDEIR